MDFGQPGGARGLLLFAATSTAVSKVVRRAALAAWALYQKYEYDSCGTETTRTASMMVTDSAKAYFTPQANCRLSVVLVTDLSKALEARRVASVFHSMYPDSAAQRFVLVIVPPQLGPEADEGIQFLLDILKDSQVAVVGIPKAKGGPAQGPAQADPML